MTNPEDQAVRKAEADWNDAILRRDPAAASEFMAPEYRLIVGIEGLPLWEMPRAQWLEALPQYVIREQKIEDLRVSIWGDVAVTVAKHYQQAEPFRGRDISGNFFITDIWVRKDGEWKVAQRHSSRQEERG
jgi:ketosteroid isomerase-like protein